MSAKNGLQAREQRFEDAEFSEVESGQLARVQGAGNRTLVPGDPCLLQCILCLRQGFDEIEVVGEQD